LIRRRKKKREKKFIMESRRRTMSSPSTAFSIVAQEALDHIVADSDNEDGTSQENIHINTHQRARRRAKVSSLIDSKFHLIRITSFFFFPRFLFLMDI